MSFYIKSEDGRFVPVKLEKVISEEDLDNNLAVIRVGTDSHPASLEDIKLTQESFIAADMLDKVKTSIIITPYQIEVGVTPLKELDDKAIYMQIVAGEDVGMLEESIRNSYRALKKRFSNLVILPTPLKISDYKSVKDTLKRCQIRRDRAGRRAAK